MRFVLFGTGNYYHRLAHWFKDRTVVAILDNDVEKYGTMLDGHRIVSPDDISDFEFDAVVIMSFYYREMKSQLLELGVDEGLIYHFYDIHDLLMKDALEVPDKEIIVPELGAGKKVLMLSHDLSLGGPSLALFNAAKVLKKNDYNVVFGSMFDGALKNTIENNGISVVIDERLQIRTMNELAWTHDYDLIICNTLNFHIFLRDRCTDIPVIWWLHDAPFYYDGVRKENMEKIDKRNLKILSVGPIPKVVLEQSRPDIRIDDLLYEVADER